MSGITKRALSAFNAFLLLAIQTIPIIAIFTIFAPNLADAADTGFKTPTATHAPNDFDVNTVANVQTSNDVYVTEDDGSEQGYSSFDFGAIPAGNTIDGIEVSVEAKSTDDGSDCQVRTSLSWDNGLTYTAAKDATIDDTEGTDVLGGPADTWGRTWALSDFTNANFVLKIQDRDPGNNCDNSAVTSVDHIQVKVYYSQKPDLTITKTNNVSGSVVVNNQFVWTLTVTNNGPGSVSFDNQDIIEDDLPNSGASYSVGTVTTGGGVTGTVDCNISSSTLDCDDNSGDSAVVIPSGGTIVVPITVTATAIGSLVNPRANDNGGTCKVDPDDLKAEGLENNNTCANTVTVTEVPVTPNPPLTQACGLDIAFVLDVSGSINNTELNQLKTAMNGLVTALNGTPTEYSVTEFDTTANVVQTFTGNTATITAAINGISGGGSTNWQDGFLKGQSTLFNRPTHPDLMIFASDGNPNTTGNPGTSVSEATAVADAKVVANSIKAGGTRILGIGIGSDLDLANMEAVTGPNDNTGNFTTSDVISSNFDTLATQMAAFASQTCGGTITTTKLIDADGVPGGATTPATGWTFDINGGSNPAATQTAGAMGQTPAVQVTPGSGYSVNETQQNGYILMSASCSGASNNGSQNGNAVTGITIAANNIVTCTFINTLAKGKIELKKVWSGTPGQTTLRIGTSQNGTQVNSTQTGAAGAAPLTTGEHNVNVGNYFVSETALPDYTASTACFNDANGNGTQNGGEAAVAVDGNGQVAVALNQDVVCTITNTRNTGGIKVNKRADANGDNVFEAVNPAGFTWSLNGSGTSAMGSTVNNVNTGNHSVNESSPAGYTFVGWYPGGTGSTQYSCTNFPQGNTTLPINVSVTTGQVTEITLCNKRDHGLVSFLKTVVGGTSQPSDWTFNISGGNGTAQSGDQKSYATGQYTVTETGPHAALYNLTGASGICSLLNGVVTMVVTTQGGQCAITNTRKTGSLKVVKDVVNNNGGNKTSANFTFQVNGGSAETFTPTGPEDGEKTLVVPTGNYTVTEPEANTMGYATSYSSCSNVAVVENQTTTCTITNNDVAPTLTLVKTVTNNNGGSKVANDFQAKIDGNNVAWSVAVPLSAGAHTASETTLPGYTASNWGQDCAANGSINLALAQNATCTITNDDVAPSLTLNKIVSNTHNGSATESNWTLYATGSGQNPTNLSGSGAAGTNDVVSGSDFKAGTYTLSESAGPSGYTPSAWTCTEGVTVNGNSQITLVNGQTTICTITNSDVAPILTIIKVVNNPYGIAAPVSAFPLFVDGQSVTSGQANTQFGAGKHTVTETQQFGYTLNQQLGGNCFWYNGNIKVNLAVGGTYSCTLTNDAIQPKLVVTKHVINDNGGTKAADDFTMTVSDNSQVVPNFSGSELGTDVLLNEGNYTVDELADSGYAKTIGENCSGTIAVGEVKYCTITNNDIAPKLTLKKTVIDDNGTTVNAEDWELTATPTSDNDQDICEVISGNGENGVVDETACGSGLTGYKLSETGPNGFSSSDWVCTGSALWSAQESNKLSLLAGEDVTCEITNDDIAPKVVLTKKTKPYSAEQDFNFTIKVGDEVYATPTLDTDNNDATYDNEYTTGADFKTGQVTITEADAEGWTNDYINCYLDDSYVNLGSNFTAELGKTYYCEAKNVESGTIKVTKFHDVDEDGYKDEDESVLPGWDINLENEDVTTKTTGEDGQVVFDDLYPDHYTISETLQDGWQQSGIYCLSNRVILFDFNEGFDNWSNKFVKEELTVKVKAGQTKECFIGNHRKAHFEIDKTNNQPNPVLAGTNVVYTLTVSVPEDSGRIYSQDCCCEQGDQEVPAFAFIDEIVIDLPEGDGCEFVPVRVADVLPDNFDYTLGSWTATSNLRGDLKAQGITPEPTYGGVAGVWTLTNEENPYLLPGEVVTLVYTVKIDPTVQPGTYTNTAFAAGYEKDCDLLLANMGPNEDEVFELQLLEAETEDPGSPFVTSDVVVYAPADPSGEVLGVTTLVNTGSSILWQVFAGASIVVLAVAISRKGRKNEN